jgi:hypothetical protein
MRAKQWKIYRCAIERDDGQRRWDEAYQFLLQCMIENREKILDKKTHEEEQEEQNGSCALCSCLNHTATNGSDN